MSQTSRDLQLNEANKKSLPVNGEETERAVSRPRQFGMGIAQFISSHYWLLCLLIGTIALGFNLYHLGFLGMWFDEILSVERARQSLPVLLQIIANTQPNMALYYVLLHFWLSLTSLLGLQPTEFVVRLPSAVFAALSSIMVFLLGRRFLGLVAGIVAAGIYLLNVLQLVYAQETRSYALQLLLICFTWYALFAILDGSSRPRRWWLGYTLVTVLAIYTQLFSLLIFAAQLAAYAGLLFLHSPWRNTARQQLRSVCISTGAVVVLISPLIYASRHGSKTGWLPIPHLIDIYRILANIAANSKIYLALLLALCLLGLLATICADRPWGKRLLSTLTFVEDAQDTRLTRLQQLLPVGFALLCWLIIPIILSYIISQGSTRLFSSRYLVTIVPPLVLLVGLGVLVIRWRLIQAVLTLCLLLLALHYMPIYYGTPQVEDWNTTSAWLQQHYQTNDGLICYDNNQGCQVAMDYYLRTYPGPAHFTSDSPGSFPWVHYDLTNQLGNAEQAVNPAVLSVFGVNHPRVFFIIGRISASTAPHAAKAQQWLDSHYHYVTQIVTPTVTIRLYDTR